MIVKQFPVKEENSVAQEILQQFPNNDIIYCRGTEITSIDTIDNNTIIAVFDYSTANITDYRYQYWETEQHIPLLDHLDNICAGKNILVLADDDTVINNHCKNLNAVHWPSIVTGNYPGNAIPVFDKNFDSRCVGVSLNRQMRVHRLALTSLLHGLEIDDSCYISFLHLYKQKDKVQSADFLDHCDWMFEPQHELLKQTLNNGFKKMLTIKQDDVEVYREYNGTVVDMDNLANYNKRLRDIYHNSFVEIISVPRFEETSPSLCEKFINSVYGCNFPIIVGPPGQVEYYENLGFDMFRDIVDHSYDTIDNPIDRLEAAIKLNRHLFNESIKHTWLKNKLRFEQNVAFAEKDLYNTIISQTVDRIKSKLAQMQG
jgi:hypothetical protein